MDYMQTPKETETPHTSEEDPLDLTAFTPVAAYIILQEMENIPQEAYRHVAKIIREISTYIPYTALDNPGEYFTKLRYAYKHLLENIQVTPSLNEEDNINDTLTIPYEENITVSDKGISYIRNCFANSNPIYTRVAVRLAIGFRVISIMEEQAMSFRFLLAPYFITGSDEEVSKWQEYYNEQFHEARVRLSRMVSDQYYWN